MILNNCIFFYPKLIPEYPNRDFDKERPSWELQIRTYDKEQKKIWEDANLTVTAVIPDEEGELPYWRANLRKRSVGSDGSEKAPVEVIDGHKQPVNPATIGNGSVGNVRLFQYEYEGKSKSGVASVLMSVQITKHIVYINTRNPDEEFDEVQTEVITPAVPTQPEEDDGYDDAPPVKVPVADAPAEPAATPPVVPKAAPTPKVAPPANPEEEL